MLSLALLPAQAHAFWFFGNEEAPPIASADWEPKAGDSFVADTKNNMGYLIHEDGGYTEFVIATGQQKVVRYIGKTYDAATPNRKWKAKSKEVQTDRVTFGARGLFLRLYADGKRTSYGIHPFLYEDEMLGAPAEERFRSLGCVIVSEDMFDVVAKTFKLNGNELDVVTVHGFNEYVTYDTLASAIK